MIFPKQAFLGIALGMHKKWLEGDGGARFVCPGADLRRSNLSGSNLSGSNLSGSDLSGSNMRYSDLSDSDLSYSDLSGSDLSGSDLSYSDLSYSDLRGSNLSDSDLSGSLGFILLPVQDARGYSFAHAVECDTGWRIRAGCRDFSISEAKQHWGESYRGDREQGDMYLYAIEWLERKLAAMQDDSNA